MHHYTYLLKCVDTGELYIGKRSCKIDPNRDSYWSSSKVVKAMMRDGKRFIKRILQEHSTSAGALSHEIELHNKYDVGRNSRFLNVSKQTSKGFDVTGTKLTVNRKKQISENNRKRVYTKETCEKISNSNKGKPAWNKGLATPEHVRQRLSDACKGRAAWNKGIKMSDTQKEKLRLTQRTDEWRLNISKAMRDKEPWNKQNKQTLASGKGN